MRRTVSTYIFCLVPLFIFSFISGQRKDVVTFFKELHADQQFNGNVLIADKNGIVYQQSLGFANLTTQLPLSSDSKFPIASISKTFTSTAILQLKQKGKLKLSDPVQKYLADFPYKEVTIKHLLSNTSGLVDYYHLFDSVMEQNPDKIITNSDIIPTLIQYKVPLSFAPGEKWEYNNVNFCIAALIVEKVSGIPYSKYLQENIFKPAGMKNSIQPFDRSVLQEGEVERYSFRNLYTTKLENVHSMPENFKISEHSNFYGNGGIVSTAEDLYLFDQSLYSGVLLGQEELNEAFTRVKLNDGKTAVYKLDEKEVGYGLGWEIYLDESNGKIVFHDGSITGLTSILVRNISQKQSVILLENNGSNAVFSASNAMIALLNQKQYDPVRQAFSRIYGSTLVDKGVKEANQLLNKYNKNPQKYRVTERELIRMGYELARQKKLASALHVFKTTTQIFPESWNAFDSYGETLLLNNEKDEAIKMYKKSIELNPKNENGKKVLKGLGEI
ncbi:serine hydrolase [Chryseobacterium paludis]|uniref:serine hydrolase n=1 Tax=Chryseobacterium paludis TaxID=2956784 RepID=UPI0021BE52CE|nr:serine hydrolase [Chryseobacterium paludis]